MMNKKAFTLIEIILVVTIIGMLSGILFKTYITMSQISFRVEQQKIVNQELLFVTEILQNLANRNYIDYDRYDSDNIRLTDAGGMTNVLFLSGEDGKVSVFSSGDCIDINDVPSRDVLDNGCNLVLEKNNQDIVLTKKMVYMTDALFKIIPFASDESYTKDALLCQSNYLACIGDPGFWFMANIYNIGHDSTWTNNVSVFVQQFFNI